MYKEKIGYTGLPVMKYRVEVWFMPWAPWAVKVHEEECVSLRDAERVAKDIEKTDEDIGCYIVKNNGEVVR